MNTRCTMLLREALDLPESERIAFLQRACVDDVSLQANLLRLLELDANADPLLDATLDGVVANLLAHGADSPTMPDDIAPGDRIGPWRIISKLGSGGMGSVWLAQRADGVYSQKVALKTIKLGMDTAMVLAQFQRERSALARLQHPNIASLLDGGVDDRGHPWFAMDHVQGVDLRDWIASRPSLDARLRLFVKLCRAIEHAHQQLVIHRDIKPGNVLVQADGEPKLLDFGIAKLLAEDDRDQTMTLHRFISRSYAAPEQLRGEAVSTVTDVYALGGLLFKLLTGKRYTHVHQHSSAPSAPSQSSQRAPTDAAIPAASLRGDLDAITMHALAEEPARRYVSAKALADDVDNFLCGRAVQARPDSTWYRLRKLIGRNRVASAALVIAVLTLITGLFVSIRQTQRAEQQAQRAEAVTRYLTGLFDAGRSTSGGTTVRERRVSDLLKDSASHLRVDLKKQPEVRDELYRILIEIFDSNDQPERSLSLARERIESAEAAWGLHDPRVAPALTMLAGVMINHDHPESVPALLQRAEQLLDAAHDNHSIERARLWQWSGFYMYVSQDHPTYTGNPLLKATNLLRRRFPDSDDLLVALLQQSLLAIGDNQYEMAQNAIDELRRRATQLHGDYNTYVTQADFAEGYLNLRTDHADKAYAIWTRSVDATRHFAGEHHHDVLMFQAKRIDALLRMQRIDEARVLWADADAQRQRDWPHDKLLGEVYAGIASQLQQPSAKQ